MTAGPTYLLLIREGHGQSEGVVEWCAFSAGLLAWALGDGDGPRAPPLRAVKVAFWGALGRSGTRSRCSRTLAAGRK